METNPKASLFILKSCQNLLVRLTLGLAFFGLMGCGGSVEEMSFEIDKPSQSALEPEANYQCTGYYNCDEQSEGEYGLIERLSRPCVYGKPGCNFERVCAAIYESFVSIVVPAEGRCKIEAVPYAGCLCESI